MYTVFFLLLSTVAPPGVRVLVKAGDIQSHCCRAGSIPTMLDTKLLELWTSKVDAKITSLYYIQCLTLSLFSCYYVGKVKCGHKFTATCNSPTKRFGLVQRHLCHIHDHDHDPGAINKGGASQERQIIFGT